MLQQHSAFCIFLTLIPGFAGEVHAQAFEGALIHLGQDHGGVDIAASQLTQLIHGQFGDRVGGGGDGQGNEGLIGVKPGIPVA